MNTTPADRQDVTRLFGTVTDHTLLRILQSGASLDQLEEVAAWLAQEDDVLGNARLPLTGAPAQVLYLLQRDAEFDPDEEP